MDKMISLKLELSYLGLFDKTMEIYSELGEKAVLSYIKSIHRLLSDVYHPGPDHEKSDKALITQQRLDKVSRIIKQMGDKDLIEFVKNNVARSIERKKKILAVEDEFDLRDIFFDVFSMEGYDVRIAADGLEGYEIYCQFQPDLVFTDVVMPNMDGLEMVKKIRAITPGVKVIYISGFFGIEELKNDFNREILKYKYPSISKPFKLSSMLKLVNDYLTEPADTLKFIRGVR